MAQAINDPNREPTLTQIGQLLHAIAAGGAQTRDADTHLQQAADNCFGLTIIRLLEILVTDDNRVTDNIRQMAGVVAARFIGGQIGHNSNEMKEILTKRWLKESNESRKFIKDASLKFMNHGNAMVRTTGANIVAKIATIETLEKWTIMDDLIKKLESDLRWHDTVFTIIYELLEDDNQATIETIKKYILKILVSMQKAIASNDTGARNAAIKCLLSIIAYLDDVMSNQTYLNGLMQMVLACCNMKEDQNMQIYGFQILCEICAFFYKELKDYFQPIFKSTGATISKGLNDETNYGEQAKIAIEFWTTCAEVEYELERSNQTHNEFIKQAAASFLNLFLQALHSQNVDDYDSEDWTIRRAASCSLESISKIIKNQIVENNAVKQFINRSWQSDKWNITEALINLVGNIMEGPDEDVIYGFLKAPLDGRTDGKNLLMMVAINLKNPNKHVANSAAWAFGKICAFCPKVIATLGTTAIVTELGGLVMTGSDKQTSCACWAMTTMVEYWYQGDYNNNNNNNNNKNEKMDVELMKKLIGALFERIKTENSGNTIIALFETLSSIISCLHNEECKIALDVLHALYNIIKSSWQSIASKNNQKQKQNNNQNNNTNNNTDTNNNNNNEETEEDSTLGHHSWVLAGALSSFTVALEHLTNEWRVTNNKNDNEPFPMVKQQVIIDIMQICCNIESASNQTAYEESLNAIASCALAVTDTMFPFLSEPQLQGLLGNALKTGKEQNNALCTTAAASISEIFHRCNQKLVEYVRKYGNNVQNVPKNDRLVSFSDEIVKLMISIISDEKVILEVKPKVIDATYGFAESFGAFSLRYWPAIIKETLSFASQNTNDINMEMDSELVEDINNVRQSAIEMLETAQLCYIEAGKSTIEFLNEYWNDMMQLLRRMKEFDKYNSKGLLKSIYDFISNVCNEDDAASMRFCDPLVKEILQLSGTTKDQELFTKAKNIYDDLLRINQQRHQQRG